jgi:hypothetical protein
MGFDKAIGPCPKLMLVVLIMSLLRLVAPAKRIRKSIRHV